jgi:NADH:ubiquinone oxidoreductase subunit 4 (chain M)
MSDLGGIAKYLPNFAILFMISGLASIGLPGFSGFISEFLILLGTFKYFPMWAIVAGVGMVLGAAYFLYMYKNVMLESASLPESKIQKLQHTMDLELHHIIPFVLILFGAFIMGIMPYNFVNIVSQTSKLILGRF